MRDARDLKPEAPANGSAAPAVVPAPVVTKSDMTATTPPGDWSTDKATQHYNINGCGAGGAFHYGLEAGSKGELLIVLAMNNDPDAITVCNGYKDEEFLRLALMGRKLGRKIIVVIEKLSELPQLLKLADEMGVEPMIG